MPRIEMEVARNKKLVFAPTVLGRLNCARSSLRFTAPQQKRYAIQGGIVETIGSN